MQKNASPHLMSAGGVTWYFISGLWNGIIGSIFLACSYLYINLYIIPILFLKTSLKTKTKTEDLSAEPKKTETGIEIEMKTLQSRSNCIFI